MASSSAKTVAEYLSSLDPEHRAVISAVRRVIRKNLPAGYKEVMDWGMISYQIPLSRYPVTYNTKPLMYAALARQKHTYTVYLTSVYQDALALAEFKDAYMATGKRLSMGKSCVHFKTLDQLPLELIGREIARIPVDEFIRRYEELRGAPDKAKTAKTTPRKAAPGRSRAAASSGKRAKAKSSRK